MKSHPDVWARRFVFTIVILSLALLVSSNPSRFVVASAIAGLHSLAIESSPIRNRNLDLKLASANLPGLTSAARDPREANDGSGTLSPDATLTWNTFLGGFTTFETAAAVAIDGSGNVYVAGHSNFTWGSPVHAHSGDDDAFVAKLDPNGNLIWNTFIGGSRSDAATGLAVDGSGNIYVVGFSTATWGSPVRAFSGGYDLFAARLDSNGNLIWHTFLGGPGINSGFDYGRALAVDTAGNVYVAGSGATWGSPVEQPFPGGGAFIARLDSNGVLIWNTFVGGSEGFGLALDQSGSVYLTGGSGGGSWGSPVRPYSGDMDAYVAKVNSGGHLIWNTFLGGTDYDFGYALALDPSGNVCVSGYSRANWGSPVRPFGGGNGEAFAVKLDPNGNLSWNTFLGGNALDFGFALAADAGGNVFVAGRSDVAWGSPVRAFGGGTGDGFVAKLDASGKLIWNAFLGGSAYDQANALAVDGKGSVYVAGESDATWGAPVRAHTSGSDGFVAKIADPAPSQTIQLTATTYAVNEGTPRVDITVSRTGDTSGIASVGFVTNDTAGSQNCNVFNHLASQRCDYLNSAGALTFAAGETSKSFSVSIVDDSYAEGDETFTVSLNNVSVAALGVPSTASITITDNDAANGPNLIDNASFFVRLHYLDFLNREPDTSGLNFWTSQITQCGVDPQCIEIKRINVSAAFFLSIEFQETGYFVERIYKASYGSPNGTSTFGGTHQLSVPIVRLNEFLPDTQAIGQGVIVGQPGWEAALENNKQAFATEFVQRPRFTTAFPPSMTPAQFVDKLNGNAGNPLSVAERNQLVTDLSTNAKTRAQVVRAVAEDSDLISAEFNRASVLMQFFGYLRRNPNDAPDSDYTGYDFWLTKLNQFNGNFVNAEMVKAFITSSEYRQRFGP